MKEAFRKRLKTHFCVNGGNAIGNNNSNSACLQICQPMLDQRLADSLFLEIRAHSDRAKQVHMNRLAETQAAEKCTSDESISCAST